MNSSFLFFLRSLHVDNEFNGEQIAKALAISRGICGHIVCVPFTDTFLSPLEQYSREYKLEKKAEIHGVMTYLQSWEPHLS